MSRYDPLKSFLERQPSERVPLSFGEIEQVLGAALPNSKRYPAWWSNNPSNNPMTKVWLEAGFVTEQVDPVAGRLTFRRVRPRDAGSNSAPGPGLIAKLQGALAGTVRFAPGFDPTEPTGETWDAQGH
jgi:hypothetical protein